MRTYYFVCVIQNRLRVRIQCIFVHRTMAVIAITSNKFKCVG